MGFTTNKVLEQVARGADVGTWDTPTNANWGVVDNSFGGVSPIALVATDVTLSPAQYQCVFLTLTGALAANVAIIFPAVGSFYTVQNLTTNTSAFQVTLRTTVAGAQAIGAPWGEPVDIFTDGSNTKYRNLGRVGEYWDYAGSSVPAWVGACTVPPYLNCDGTTFSSATYPVLSVILGSSILPDSRGRARLSLNQGTARLNSTTSIDGNTRFTGGGSEQYQQHNHTLTVTDPGHSHTTYGLRSDNIQAGGDFNVVAQLLNGALNTTTSTNTTGITVASSAAGTGTTGNVQPSYIGGITMIRSA